MSSPLYDGDTRRGGVEVSSLDRLYEEMAFIAYHFHWSNDEIMQMDHRERRKWVSEITAINTRLDATVEEKNE